MAPKVDPRNRELRFYINGKFVGRDQAALSLMDAGFLHGKQIWSSPRLIDGHIFRLWDHLAKIRHGAEMIHCPKIPRDEEFIAAIRATLVENKMHTGVHVRILMTPGNQVTASMDIGAVIDWQGNPSEPTIIVMPEYRDMVYDASAGVTLITSRFKRPGPDVVDKTIHDNNQNDSARACHEAKKAGATAAVMFDTEGYLAEAHASHMAIVKDGALATPLVRCCPPGVTRRVILELCEANGIAAREADITPDDLAAADEVFLMGTMSGPVGAIELDGRVIGDGRVGELTRRISGLYAAALRDPSQGYDIFAEA